jgi:hypothetical protein
VVWSEVDSYFQLENKKESKLTMVFLLQQLCSVECRLLLQYFLRPESASQCFGNRHLGPENKVIDAMAEELN